MNPLYERVIDDLIVNSYAIADGFLEEAVLQGLRNQLLLKIAAEDLNRAGVGNKTNLVKNQQIRTDKIQWIAADSTEPSEEIFNRQIKDFCDYLNRTCYAGIRDAEFHYACFEKGAFYKRHIDRFRNDNARKFSMVTYLNDTWEEHDGGHLMIYKDQADIAVSPIWGRTVIFKSDVLEHEVMVAQKDRLSVTGWLRG